MTTPLLETRGVWQRFGGLVANSDVSISVGRGEIVGLIGPNGAGKSTLFNLIAGVLPPTQGSIWFDGEDVTSLPAAERCQRGIARTFQVVKSFETMTVIDNVIVGALVRTTVMREARRKAHEVLEFAGLAGRAEVPASELIPSEKRRLEVARALATEPKLLLLDEVLTGLTPIEVRFRSPTAFITIRMSGLISSRLLTFASPRSSGKNSTSIETSVAATNGLVENAGSSAIVRPLTSTDTPHPICACIFPT